MSSKAISPTANILRSSRLFSLPAAQRKPVADLPSNHAVFTSDTSTLPHPILQAIETTAAARSKGDWGLKRNLPLRSTTRSSTPVIRVAAVDTAQHVTDFSSAADHALTLLKWRELHLALTGVVTQPSTASAQVRSAIPSPRSAFETDWDRTFERRRPGEPTQRWKFAGPWLPGQTQQQFAVFVRRHVRGRQPAFLDFLREYRARAEWREEGVRARDEGRMGRPTAAAMDARELAGYVRELRQQVGSLSLVMHDFLDLPRSSTGVSYSDTGPPKMHPSAGLSYLRTHRLLPNQASFGPQPQPGSVPARVLQPQSAGGGPARLGVAGVVADDAHTASFSRGLERGISQWDAVSRGGRKIWVDARAACIDFNGQILLRTVRGRPDRLLWPSQSYFAPPSASARPHPRPHPRPSAARPVERDDVVADHTTPEAQAPPPPTPPSPAAPAPGPARRSAADIMHDLAPTTRPGYGLEEARMPDAPRGSGRPASSASADRADRADLGHLLGG
ncbi:MAG: hypothetical protein M1826_000168 [Phylliscum demangeonii]|nr:MAG: hypothetical protein M1826_000168 [Phylliscum demangeonii]